MKTLKKTLILAPLLAFHALVVEAQNIILKKSDAEINPPSQKLLICPNGDYLAFSCSYDNSTAPAISRFAQGSLSLQYNNSLQEFKKENFLAAEYGGDRLFVFSANKDGNISKYEIDDKNGSVTGAPLALFKVEGVNNYSFGSSSNGQFHYFMAVRYDAKLKTSYVQGVVMDQRMNTTGNFSTTIQAERPGFTDFNVLQDENGLLSIICVGTIPFDKVEYKPMSYTLVQVDTKGNVRSAPMAGMPSGTLKNFSWTTDGQQLSFAAFQIKYSKDKGFTYFVTGVYDPRQNKCSDIREYELNAMLKQPRNIIVEIQHSGLDWDVEMLKTISFSDGSRALILEGGSALSSMKGYGPAHNGVHAASGSVTLYQRYNLYIMKVDKANMPQWFQIVPRFQQESDYPLAVGTAAISDSLDNIHLFFYARKKDVETFNPHIIHVNTFNYNSTRLADVMIAPEGKITKQLYEVPEPEFRLRPEVAFTDRKNRVLLVAIKPLTPAFRDIYEHSHYKIAAIEVKN